MPMSVIAARAATTATTIQPQRMPGGGGPAAATGVPGPAYPGPTGGADRSNPAAGGQPPGAWGGGGTGRDGAQGPVGCGVAPVGPVVVGAGIGLRPLRGRCSVSLIMT